MQSLLEQRISSLRRKAEQIERSARFLSHEDRNTLAEIRQKIFILTTKPLVFKHDFKQPACTHPPEDKNVARSRIRSYFGRL